MIMRRGIILFWLAWLFACLMGASLVSGGTVRYTYDDAGRLIQADYGDYAIIYTYDNAGNLLETRTGPIIVGPPPKILRFMARPSNVQLGDRVNFLWISRDPERERVLCDLDLDGDGTQDMTDGRAIGIYRHSYAAGGTYQAKLTARTEDGRRASDIEEVVVAAPDLTVEWESLKLRVNNRGQNLAKGFLRVDNLGDPPVHKLKVKVLAYWPNGRKSSKMVTFKANREQVKRVRLKRNLGRRDYSGRPVVAVVDPNNRVPEADEGNNEAVERLPSP